MKAAEQALYQAAALTFEELGFMFTTGEVDETQLASPIEAAVTVDFTGPLKGKLELRVTDGLLEAIASNMLGEDTPPSIEMQRDALGEMANVICGNVLPAVSGSQEIFRLSAPKVISLNDVSSGNSEPTAAVNIGLENGRADVLIYLEGNSQAN